MTSKQANNFLVDIGAQLEEDDYTQDVYLSIQNIGTKTFKYACTQTIEGWLFIWTKTESFCVSEKELGEYVCVESKLMPIYNLKS